MNQYIVIKTMGRGAYGKVKLCLDSQTHELYAIKVVNHSRATRRPRALPGSRQAHSTLDADVVQEIAVMKQLDHPNIVRLVEVIGAAPHGVARHMQGARLPTCADLPVLGRACISWQMAAVRLAPACCCHALPVVCCALLPADNQTQYTGVALLGVLGIASMSQLSMSCASSARDNGHGDKQHALSCVDNTDCGSLPGQVASACCMGHVSPGGLCCRCSKMNQSIPVHTALKPPLTSSNHRCHCSQPSGCVAVQTCPRVTSC